MLVSCIYVCCLLSVCFLSVTCSWKHCMWYACLVHLSVLFVVWVLVVSDMQLKALYVVCVSCSYTYVLYKRPNKMPSRCCVCLCACVFVFVCVPVRYKHLRAHALFYACNHLQRGWLVLIHRDTLLRALHTQTEILPVQTTEAPCTWAHERPIHLSTADT